MENPLPIPDKIDVMEDLQGNAHALLYLLYYPIYDTLLRSHFIGPRDIWHPPQNAPLFWGLVAFAQPEIFKKEYRRHESAFTIISDALNYMYCSPMEIQEANRALDNNLQNGREYLGRG